MPRNGGFVEVGLREKERKERKKKVSFSLFVEKRTRKEKLFSSLFLLSTSTSTTSTPLTFFALS
jgi:hypothetical protein